MRLKISNRQKKRAGNKYEYSIASLLRQDGWEVFHNGQYGFEDHGIDLIAKKNGITRYIQCKGWKRWKTIHDSVVSQLYGSVMATIQSENIENIELYIYSPAKLTPYAEEVAKKLNIKFERQGFPHWKRKKSFIRS
jgi:hypothetical protein